MLESSRRDGLPTECRRNFVLLDIPDKLQPRSRTTSWTNCNLDPGQHPGQMQPRSRTTSRTYATSIPDNIPDKCNLDPGITSILEKILFLCSLFVNIPDSLFCAHRGYNSTRCIDMYVDMYEDMCIDMCIDVCIDTRMDAHMRICWRCATQHRGSSRRDRRKESSRSGVVQ